VLRFAFDDPREIGPLLPGVEDETEDFYAVTTKGSGHCPVPRR
jgi:hypothetical protein